MLSLDASVSSPSRTHGEKTASSFDSNDYECLLETLDLDIPDISIDSGKEIKESVKDSILSVCQVLGSNEVSTNLTSQKAVAKKSTGARQRLQRNSTAHSRTTTNDVLPLEKSLIKISSHLEVNTSKDDSNGVLEKYIFNEGKDQQHSELSNEMSTLTPICKILSVSSISQSEDKQIKRNKNLTAKSDVSEGEILKTKFDCVNNGDILSKNLLDNESSGYSKLHSTYLSAAKETTVNKEFSVVDINKLLKASARENIDTEPKFCERKKIITKNGTEKISVLRDDSISKQINGLYYKNKNKHIKISSDIGKSNNQSGHLQKCASYNWNTELYNNNMNCSVPDDYSTKSCGKPTKPVLIIRRTRARKATNQLPSNIVANPINTSSTLIKQTSKSPTTLCENSPKIIYSNSKNKVSVSDRRKEIFTKPRIKGLTPLNFLDYFTEDDILILGGEVSEVCYLFISMCLLCPLSCVVYLLGA